MKANTWTWAILLLLTASSFSLSTTAPGYFAAACILGGAGVKAGLVGWRFMDLHGAHILWKLGLAALLCVLLGVLLLLERVLLPS